MHSDRLGRHKRIHSVRICYHEHDRYKRRYRMDVSTPSLNPPATTTEQKRQMSNKFLAMVLAGILTTLFGALAVLFYLGFFTRVQIEQIQSPAYRIAYLQHVGPYNQIEPTINLVAESLNKAGLAADTPFALLLDDNGQVKPENRRSWAGYLLPEQTAVPAGLLEDTIRSREVLRVRFSGGTLMGSYKAYQAMKEWAAAKGYQLVLPALEIYHPGQPKEYQLGIRKKL